MAIITGSFKMKGPLGNFSTYTTKRGTTVIREKGGPSRQMVLQSPKFQRCRENFSEFSGASVLAGQIRRSFSHYMEYMSEGSYFNRLVALIRMMGQTDMINARGAREPLGGNVHMLEGFEWNRKLHFEDAFEADFDSYTDINTGKIRVEIPSFVPLAKIKAPVGATHFQIILKGTVAGGSKAPVYVPAVSELVALNGQESGDISLTLDMDTTSGGILISGIGILFYEDVEGIPLAMRGGAFSISAVERIIQAGTDAEAHTGEKGQPKSAIRMLAMERMLQAMREGSMFNERRAGPIYTNARQQKEMKEKMIQLACQMWLRKAERLRKG